MQDLHTMGIDKSSCKAELEEHQFHVHALTKDSFKKAYQESHASDDQKSE